MGAHPRSEGRKPGSFSLRTLSVLRALSSEDARAFAETLAVSVRGGGVTWVPSWSYFKSHYEPVLSLTYETFLRLDAAGLIAMKDSAFGAPGGVDFWLLNGRFRVPADAGTIAVYVLTQASRYGGRRDRRDPIREAELARDRLVIAETDRNAA